MNHYRQTLVLEANPATVHAALTTSEGLCGWWTRDCDVATENGGTHHFRFGASHKSMRIESQLPAKEVRWLCTAAHVVAPGVERPDEWVGTSVVFRLSPEGSGRTRLEFEHVGLVPTLSCHDLCCRGWAHFLESLRQYVECGRGTPHEIDASCAH